MRQVITLLFFGAAALGYASDFGPLFLGAPLLGSIFAVAGMVFELTATRRVPDSVQE